MGSVCSAKAQKHGSQESLLRQNDESLTVNSGSQGHLHSAEVPRPRESSVEIQEGISTEVLHPKGKLKSTVKSGSKETSLSKDQENLCCLIISPLRKALADSALLWILYVSISFCIYFLLLYTTEREGNNHHLYADIVLIISMIVGFIFQVICLCCKSKKNFVRVGRLPHDHSNAYLMAGVYVFGIGTLFTILLRIVIYYHAEEQVVGCDFDKVSQFPVVDALKAGVQNGTSGNITKFKPLVLFGGFCKIDVTFDFIRLSFTLIQLCFIQTFRSATFNKYISVRFTLYHTLLTNGCIWIRYTIDETHLFEHAEYRSSIDRFVRSAFEIEEIMIPFILEYSLVAAGLLYNISAQMKDFGSAEEAHFPTSSGDRNKTQKIEMDDRNKDVPRASTSWGDIDNPQTMSGKNIAADDASTSSGDFDSPQTMSGKNIAADDAFTTSGGCHQTMDDRTIGAAHASISSNDNDIIQVIQIDDRDPEVAHSPASSDEGAKGTSKIVPGFQPGLIFGAIFGLLLPVLSLTFGARDTKFSRRSHDLFLVYEGILAILQITSIYLILIMLQKHIISVHKLRSEDTLLLAGYLGTFAFHFMAFYSVITALRGSQENKSTNKISVAHLLFLVISQLLQAILVITSSRYSCKQEEEVSARIIQELSLFLLTTNLGFWALDSFFEMKDSASSSYPTGKTVLEDAWNIITSITYPFVVFYRFHSAQMFYEIWSRFKIKS